MPKPRGPLPQVVYIHPDAPPQPAWGQPCNGCGVCCLAEPCPLGMVLSRRRRGSCIALRWDAAASQYRCGALVDPPAFLPVGWRWVASLWRRWVHRWIAAGQGCDATLRGERDSGPGRGH
ncbi:hypothetical protein [Tepidicella xavieri]|uniref:4Fe-4S ferredoxin-type domain-containing protein n=1 Tax=Tepidicella xavieri TaxID=360241 RepID=A0A4R6UFA6_9BURK|nr:hypothetical protein [Tepidicella xavieri]TDQ41794.1 hypothetical protein DFR43_11148 [Tepidicella xavieri]